MAGLHIYQEKLTPELAARLAAVCPFGALKADGAGLSVEAGCRMCRLCVKKSGGVIVEQKDERPAIDKNEWRGVAVLADYSHGRLHPVTLELLGKARELVKVTGHPVYAVLMGHGTEQAARIVAAGGADRVFVYDSPELAEFAVEPYADAFADFIRKVKPSSVLVGATNLGRSLAPRVAARFRTGLTADCTALEMRENTDLVQIRPAFGGNVMAQIITPNHRPQFCTVRYKIFSACECPPEPGEIVPMAMPGAEKPYGIKIRRVTAMPAEVDISEADVLVAVGRGVKNEEDMELAAKLAELLGGQLACSRPLVEAGIFDAKHQIGLSGRTVKPKLLITLGISGAVQFAAGIQGAECVVAVNSDPNAPIFDSAHYSVVGDLSKLLPKLVGKLKARDEARMDTTKQNGQAARKPAAAAEGFSQAAVREEADHVS